MSKNIVQEAKVLLGSYDLTSYYAGSAHGVAIQLTVNGYEKSGIPANLSFIALTPIQAATLGKQLMDWSGSV